MKRTLLLVAALVAVVSIIGGAVTMALFSDSVQAPGEIVAGTLAIDGQRDNGDTIPGPMFYLGHDDPTGLWPSDGPDPWGKGASTPGGWAPGDEIHRVLQVENTGTLDAKLTTVRAALQSGSRDLADKLQVIVARDKDKADIVAQGTLGQFLDADQSLGDIEADVSDLIDLHFFVSLPLAAGNVYQELETVVSFTVNAEQLRNNP